MIIAETFGDLVRKERTNAGLSYSELARLTDVSISYISRIEKGERGNVTVSMLLNLCKTLNIDVMEALETYGYEKKESLEESVFQWNASANLSKEKKEYVRYAIDALIDPEVGSIEAMERCLESIKNVKQRKNP